MDRLLDEARSGPVYLKQPRLAQMVVAAIHHHEADYTLHAYVVMPNHVHLLISPQVALPLVMKSLKGYTAKQANWILGLTGRPFWQAESYDHLVRSPQEFARIVRYIENNPVRAGLVAEATSFSWSSAGRPGGCPQT